MDLTRNLSTIRSFLGGLRHFFMLLKRNYFCTKPLYNKKRLNNSFNSSKLRAHVGLALRNLVLSNLFSLSSITYLQIHCGIPISLSKTPITRIKSRFPWICFTVILPPIFRTPDFSNQFWFPLEVRAIGIPLYRQLEQSGHGSFLMFLEFFSAISGELNSMFWDKATSKYDK